MIPPETRDLARRLLAFEAADGINPAATESAALRVYDKLRRPLCALAGVAGFCSLASRALALSRAETPSLSAVQVRADGSLQGLGDSQIDQDQEGDAGAILVAQLLELLFIFIGAALTIRLVQDAWPDAAFNDPGSGNERKS
jgi:hypothetical protein